MNQLTTFFMCLLLGFIATQGTAQILYSEDFEGTNNLMPTNITVIDGDVAPANAGVAAFDQWVVIENFRTAGDTIAAVTSYLDPAGQSDDWLITPQVAGITASTNLSWEAAALDPAFRDGYEVWVATSIAGATPVISDFTTGGTMVFTIAAEDTLFTAHTVSLGAFAGQSVYVGFRNNSNDQYILGLDDILIEAVASPLAATFIATPASCGNSNGSIALTTTGGTAPYTYLWGAGTGNQTTATATNLAAGTYGITITDALNNVISGTATAGASASLNIFAENFEGTGGNIPAGFTVIDADAAGAFAGLAVYDQWIVVNSSET
ncbi:MAG: choice-of-anchor J domain-containing protein, partial [Aureispira sp.]